MTATELAHALAARAPEFAEWLYPKGRRVGHDWCIGSLAGEAGASLHICVTGDRSGFWLDFAGGEEERGDLVGLLKLARGLDLHRACDEAGIWLGLTPEQMANGSGPKVAAAPRIETSRVPSETWTKLQATMRRGSFAELSALSLLRELPCVAGLELATRSGQLFFASLWDDGYEWLAWLLTDSARKNAQARRLDGEPWSGIDAKAKTVPGCEASWPVGISEAANKPVVWLVEGGPDLLAAWHFIWLTESVATTAPVAMLGVNMAIHPGALPFFKGKAVRIFAHNDPDLKGLNGAIRWRGQLLGAGAMAVDFFDFRPGGHKDLNEFATQHGVPD